MKRKVLSRCHFHGTQKDRLDSNFCTCIVIFTQLTSAFIQQKYIMHFSCGRLASMIYCFHFEAANQSKKNCSHKKRRKDTQTNKLRGGEQKAGNNRKKYKGRKRKEKTPAKR